MHRYIDMYTHIDTHMYRGTDTQIHTDTCTDTDTHRHMHVLVNRKIGQRCYFKQEF